MAPLPSVVLGIDVGLVNFAYCVRDKTTRREIRKIENVDLVELYNDTRKHRRGSKTFRKLTYDNIHQICAIVFSHVLTPQLVKNVDAIRIECMPPKSKKKIWLLSHLIFQYCTTAFQVSCRLVHAKKKFECHKHLVPHFLQRTKTYEGRKSVATKLFLDFMRAKDIDPAPLGPKLDDVADAFLLTYC